MALEIWDDIAIFVFQSKTIRLFLKESFRVPLCMNSETIMIEESVGSMQAPMNRTMFGCFRLDQIVSSRENSSIILSTESDTMEEFEATLIATSVTPLSFP